MWRSFLQLVASLGDNLAVFHYGSYETSFFKRMRKSSTRKAVVTKLLSRSVNLLSLVHAHVYFPVHSNGLKDIAGHMGFRWTDPEASGVQSVVWRRRWEQSGDPAWKDRLGTYNREDCEALRFCEPGTGDDR